MSSNESSGAAPAEPTATPPANPAAPTQFGSSRGSGLARGKRPSTSPTAPTASAPSDYKPTAIEVVSAPREYQNPFAPAETPAAVTPELAPVPAPVAPVVNAAPAATPAPLETPVPAPSSAPTDEKVGLNILEPERPKAVPAQTWESEGFRPAREPRESRAGERTERPRREEVPVPAKFRYERAKDGPLPQRGPLPAAARSNPPAKKTGGFLGWLKSLFSSTPTAPAVPARDGEHRHDRDGRGGHRRHRGGRGRNHGYQPGGQGGEPRGEHASPGGEGHGEHRGEHGGGHRRHRGGRGRSHSHQRGEHRGGGEPGGPAVN